MAPRAFLIPIVLGLFVLAAPAAQADIVVSVTGPDSGPEITPGESGSVDVEVSIATNGNVVCPQDGDVTIALRPTLTDDSLGLSGSVEPASLTFTITAGAYLEAAGQTFASDPQTATLTMSIDASKLPPGHPSHTIAASATYDGSAVGTCQGDIGTGEERSASHSVNFPIEQVPQDDTQAPGGGGGGGGGNNTDDGDDAPAEEGPAPGVFALVLVGLALAAMRRRR